MQIERRLRDRNEDAVSNRWVWKLIGLSLLATVVIYLLLTHFR